MKKVSDILMAGFFLVLSGFFLIISIIEFGNFLSPSGTDDYLFSSCCSLMLFILFFTFAVETDDTFLPVKKSQRPQTIRYRNPEWAAWQKREKIRLMRKEGLEHLRSLWIDYKIDYSLAYKLLIEVHEFSEDDAKNFLTRTISSSGKKVENIVEEEEIDRICRKCLRYPCRCCRKCLRYPCRCQSSGLHSDV